MAEIKRGENGYDELYAELLRLIPIYSKEWTNYNNTDPGITILQSLAQLAVWQNNAIGEPNAEIAEKLLALLSLHGSGCTAASVMVGLTGEVESLPPGTQIIGGKSCYELVQNQNLYTGRPVMLCARTERSEIEELSHLLYSGISTFVYPFGEKPTQGMEFYIGLDKPMLVGRVLKIYMDFTDSSNMRVPFSEDNKLIFARLRWEYYTENGFKEAWIADKTFGFMRSEVVALYIPEEMAEFDIVGRSSFCIRVTLAEQHYDCPPKLCNIYCNPVLFRQQKTIARQLFFGYQDDSDNSCHIYARDAGEQTIMMLLQCGDGLWRRCDYKLTVHNVDDITLLPTIREDMEVIVSRRSIMIILYEPEYTSYMELDMLYGYDNQGVELPFNGTMAEGFKTMLVMRDRFGEPFYVEEGNDDYPYSYHFDHNGTTLIIDKASFGEDNRLIITSCAVTSGSKGNVRPQELQNAACPEGIMVVANTQGTGGTDGLTMGDLKEKLAFMLRCPDVAVSEDDYERLTRMVPGLRIGRVRAYSTGDNTVKIAVEPISEQHFPRLGKLYRNAIEEYLEKHRLITTKIKVVEPVYLPIDVYLLVHVKPYALEVEGVLRDIISQELDYYRNGCDFGSTVLYNRLYSRLEQMECVEYIERMTMDADSSYGQSVVDGNDICLSRCALPYLRKADIRQLTGL